MMKNKKVYLCSFGDTRLGISLDSKKHICSMGGGGGGIILLFLVFIF